MTMESMPLRWRRWASNRPAGPAPTMPTCVRRGLIWCQTFVELRSTGLAGKPVRRQDCLPHLTTWTCSVEGDIALDSFDYHCYALAYSYAHCAEGISFAGSV